MSDISLDGLQKCYDQLQNIGNQIAKKMAIKYREMLCEEYTRSVDDLFYDAYEPKVYKRTYSLKNSYRPFYKNPHGNIVRGGVEFCSDKMGEHEVDNNYILGLALSGYHGNKSIYTSPTLYNHMISYRNFLVADAQAICDSVYN